jgi:hypothetical protein
MSQVVLQDKWNKHMQSNTTYSLDKALDMLMEGADLDAQGYPAKVAARQLLKEAWRKYYIQGGRELVEFALPITRRLFCDPEWLHKLDLQDLTDYCVAKLPGYPTGVESQHADVEAEYLSACAEDYLARW